MLRNPLMDANLHDCDGTKRLWPPDSRKAVKLEKPVVFVVVTRGLTRRKFPGIKWFL